MASFDNLVTIANNTGFQQRVSYAMAVAAVNVMSEAASTTGHGNRVDFAERIIAGSFQIAPYAQAVLTNATIAAEANSTVTPDYSIPDADIQFAVNSLWNAFSGVSN